MTAPQRQKLDYLSDEEVEIAPERILPRSSYFSIEYPAILGYRKDDDLTHPDEHPALSNALSSLSPRPPPYANPVSALRHIGRLSGKTDKAPLECRLGHACLSSTAGIISKQEEHPVSNNEVYRHPIIGEVLDAHNIVLKVTKRVWRKKQRDGPALQQNGEGSSERKEYTAVAIGITRRVARFRGLADFQYDPGYINKSASGDDQEEATKQALSLYDSLAQMDIEALRNVTLEEEKADYEIERDVPGKGKVRVSNIRLPPPQLFDRVEVPFTYGFRQNPTSNLQEYGKAGPDGKKPLRYMNKLKFTQMAPIPFSLASKAGKSVPPRPRDVVKESRKVNEELYRQLKELFDKEPVWTRLKIGNQFPQGERRSVFNQKQPLAACCYTITDGCFRDCLIRYDYDPRKNKEDRFYQKISFQKNPRSSKAARMASSTVEPETIVPPSLQDADNVMEDETDDGLSHIFDGVTPGRVRGNYLLIDVRDEYVRPLIDQEGPGVLRNKFDITTGWYTEKHWEKIRSVFHARYHRLLEGGVPLPKEDCDAIIAQIDNSGTIRPNKPTTVRSKKPGSTASTVAS